MHIPRLCSPRLAMDPVERGDLPDVFRINSDPEVARYGSHGPWQSFAQAEAWFERVEAGHASGEALQFIMKRLSDGAVVGLCTLFKCDTGNRRAEIGYALARDAWGQGYMHEALTALLDHGFGPLRLHRVEADIDPHNVRSAASLRRLGFAQEGLLRERWIVDGVVSDSALYGLLASEWRKLRSA